MITLAAYLEKRGLITFAVAPGDDEVIVVLGEGFGESDPANSTLLNAATSGSPPAGLAQKRAPDGSGTWREVRRRVQLPLVGRDAEHRPCSRGAHLSHGGPDDEKSPAGKCRGDGSVRARMVISCTWSSRPEVL